MKGNRRESSHFVDKKKQKQKRRTTSQLKTKAGSPFSSASKVYPAGRVAGAVTWTMIGRTFPTGFKGVLAADAMVKQEGK
jgi:hypothetical protein